MITDISVRLYSFLMGIVHSREEGQDLIEYALLGGGIAAAILVGFLLFDDAIANMVSGIGECIDFDSTPCGGPF